MYSICQHMDQRYPKMRIQYLSITISKEETSFSISIGIKKGGGGGAPLGTDKIWCGNYTYTGRGEISNKHSSHLNYSICD